MIHITTIRRTKMSEQTILDLIQKMHAKIDAVAVAVKDIQEVRGDVYTATQELADEIGNLTRASTKEIKDSIRLAAAETAESVKEHLQVSCKEANYRLKVIANLHAASPLTPEQADAWKTLQNIREIGAEIHQENQKVLLALKGMADQSTEECKALNAKLERLAEGSEAYNRLLSSQLETIAEATMH